MTGCELGVVQSLNVANETKMPRRQAIFLGVILCAMFLHMTKGAAMAVLVNVFGSIVGRRKRKSLRVGNCIHKSKRMLRLVFSRSVFIVEEFESI